LNNGFTGIPTEVSLVNGTNTFYVRTDATAGYNYLIFSAPPTSGGGEYYLDRIVVEKQTGAGFSGGKIPPTPINLSAFSGVSGPLSDAVVTVNCSACTTNSIISITPIYNASFFGTDPVDFFMIQRLNGSFKIYSTSSRGDTDGLMFTWNLVKP